MALTDFPQAIHDFYEIHEWKHGIAVLKYDFPNEWEDLLYVLSAFRLRHDSVANPGKNKSKVAIEIDYWFNQRGWSKRKFDTEIHVDKDVIKSPTHEVDQFKNNIAMETEWNNKDPFYDRDLNNFRLLFELRKVDVGIIITRCDELQDIFDELGRGDSYGESTTHMRKLLYKIEGGGGGGCPLIAIGIRKSLYDLLHPAFLLPEKIKIPKPRGKKYNNNTEPMF